MPDALSITLNVSFNGNVAQHEIGRRQGVDARKVSTFHMVHKIQSVKRLMRLGFPRAESGILQVQVALDTMRQTASILIYLFCRITRPENCSGGAKMTVRPSAWKTINRRFSGQE
jgi:hypothetical protein